jgi:UDP-N-acetylmuramoylalanine--D-glutamate ligase
MIEGVFVDQNGILFDTGMKITDLASCPNLKGRHNWQNAAMAYAAAKSAGADAENIIKGLHSFPGLAHRQKTIATIKGIAYINDSKATNDQAAAMALSTYHPIYWIAGGKPKGGGYPDCENHLDHVRHAFLIGAAEEAMAAWLEKHRKPYTRCGTLEKAVAEAHILAQTEKQPGAVILLSPACASFDQFRSFEHRGEVFTALVAEKERETA